MSFVIQQGGSTVPLTPGAAIVTNGVQFSWDTMLSWSDTERATYGISHVDDAPTVPASITRLQGRLALNAVGLLGQVDAAVAAADAATQIWYADALTWHRADPILAAMASVLGLSSSQVDALFVQAAAL